jgi:hypothetical protein
LSSRPARRASGRCHVTKRRASESLMARYSVKFRQLRATRSSHRTGAVGEGRRGSIVRLICDSSELYLSATTDADWITREGLDPCRDWFARFRIPALQRLRCNGKDAQAAALPERLGERRYPTFSCPSHYVQRAPRAVRIDPERSFAGYIVGRSLQPEREKGDALRTDPRRATPFLPLCTTLPLFTTACAGRGPQNSDQQERHGGPLKPDVVEAAKHVDQKQEDYEGDHHSG